MTSQVPGLVLSLVLAHFVNRKHAFAIPTACIAAVLLPLLSQRIAWSGTVACLWLARMFSYAAFNLLWALTVELFPTSSRWAYMRGWARCAARTRLARHPVAAPLCPSPGTEAALPPPPFRQVLCPWHHKRNGQHRRPRQPLCCSRGAHCASGTDRTACGSAQMWHALSGRTARLKPQLRLHVGRSLGHARTSPLPMASRPPSQATSRHCSQRR